MVSIYSFNIYRKENAPLAFLLHLATAMCNLHPQVVLILLNRYSLPHPGTAVPNLNSTTNLPLTFPLSFHSTKTTNNYQFALALSLLNQNFHQYSNHGRYSIITDIAGSKTTTGVNLEVSTQLSTN